MTLAIMIAGCLAIGILLPRWMIRRHAGRFAVVLASLVTLIAAGAFVFLAAQIFGALGLGDPAVEFNNGLNGWKFLLLLAPAVAIHTRRSMASHTP